MDTTQRAMTMAELLPGLGGLLSKESMQKIALTATKKPRSTMANTSTTVKVLKPLTLAEMKTEMQTLQTKSPRPNKHALASNKKRWNSSAKLECKTISHTANGQMKHNSVRKVLNFQLPKPKAPKVKTFTNSRMTMLSSDAPMFPKPEMKVKKSLHQARNTVNISGICNIPETPVLQKKPIQSRMTLANKENISNLVAVNKKLTATPKSILRKRVLASRIPDTPLSNKSWKSSCDESFLQNEKDIEYIESKTKALEEKDTQNIAEITPPVSTPFAHYQNINDFFNSNIMENTCADDTIMSFEQSGNKENITREESVIVSLCDMLNRATVSNTNTHTQLEDLLEMCKQTKNNIKMIENGIRSLNKIRESQMKSLQCLNKLIEERKNQRTSESEEKTVIEPAKEPLKFHETLKLERIVDSKPSSVIKTTIKSPSYKIPSKVRLRKSFCKSVPNITLTPQKDMGEKALSMYMKLKEQHNFLNTPVVKQRPLVPDTPAITSHNLQKQLDKLYK